MKKELAVVLVSLMVVACNTSPKKDGSATGQADTKAGSTATVGQANDGQTAATAGAAGAAGGQGGSIYFGFQEASIAPQYTGVIRDEAQSIKHAGTSNVTVEGNCDERGSAEYNLGLGQRRADAVKKLLVAAGVPARQVKAVSQGKEKPKATCHDESCWKENRRVDFVQGS